jgi:hypothetical protein
MDPAWGGSGHRLSDRRHLPGHPAPGWHGDHLAVTATLIGFGLGLLGFEPVAAKPGVTRLLMLLLMIASAATLVALQPDGPGFLGMIPPIAAAAFRLERRAAIAVAGLSLAAVAVGAAIGRGRPADPVILDELALASYWALAAFASRFIRADQRSQFMIAQIGRDPRRPSPGRGPRRAPASGPRDARRGTGYGLTGMRERAELLGSTLTAGPTTEGFRVELWAPG